MFCIIFIQNWIFLSNSMPQIKLKGFKKINKNVKHQFII